MAFTTILQKLRSTFAGKPLATHCNVCDQPVQAFSSLPILLGLTAIDEDPTVTDPSKRWRRFGQDDHLRLYSKEGFMERVREAGFQMSNLGVKHFGRKAFLRHGITAQSVLYVAVKPKRE